MFKSGNGIKRALEMKSECLRGCFNLFTKKTNEIRGVLVTKLVTDFFYRKVRVN